MAGYSFDVFKKEIIDALKNSQINQQLHQYITASTWGEVIQIFCDLFHSEECSALWYINRDIINERLLAKVGTAYLMNAHIYNINISQNNPDYNIILRPGASLILTMNGSNKSKLIMLGGTANISMSGTSFLEIELYNEACVNIECSESAYVYVTTHHHSEVNLQLKNNSICRLLMKGNSTGEANIQDDAFLNISAAFKSILQVKGKTNNAKYYRYEGASIRRQGV